ncbi:outer membrane protein assembly factor BamA [Catalinimonas alkaloidigena]|uniref:POTRA domain-containing protein n=1 Tax=Catalinimonas alkaloidigena TaxID=1075417 RepID=UPI002405CEA8|nr:POTRA domain-containing protein [Catalinimonas alkaloidigena]MDF9796030.1 outer membrane protein assembly factor BamA [Catalinimonas alkaloidigena]
MFLLLIPLIASLLFLFSCIDEGHEDLQSVTDAALVEQPNAQASIKDGNKIASIRWEGNSVYSDEQLSEALDLKPGDFYNEELLNSRLYYNPGLDDLSSLYMDHGYLFFNISVKEIKVEPGVNELVFDIYEGEQVKTKNIIIKGNQSVSKEEILSQLVIKSGDWFNRADLIASQKAIAEMGYFDAKNVRINPIPHADEGTVDIEFVLTEINAKN